ncbi:MAG: Mrp/NBP35 family ATP-binding protein [Lachnospiraceae bacterium]|nr:Mrp/NBP35 family ATP-binding protein [Lachnospiraceae bacterium]
MARECDNTSCTKEDCSTCKDRQTGGIPKERCNDFSEIHRVIGVISGKGGVGKSFVAASLANQLAEKGYRVGILDADVTGPSIPKMYGLTGAATANDNGIEPMVTKNGIKVISVNLLLPTEETPVIWRGPVIANMVKQFWTDVIWEELDYLLVDMPPGTGDVPLTVFQSLPVDGVVIVTSPQDLVRMIVKKAYNMADMMHVPVLGIVENYSYVKCPDCGKELKVFGESHIEEIAEELKVPLLGKMPLEPQFAACADEGRFQDVENAYLTGGVQAMPAIEK